MTEALHDVATLDEVDRDGAVREAAEAVQGDTRAALLRKGGILAGIGLGFAALPAGFALAQGRPPRATSKILNYALTLEYLEAAFYAEAIDEGQARRASPRRFAQVVGAHEEAHVDALKAALGSKAVKAPTFDFKGTTGTGHVPAHGARRWRTPASPPTRARRRASRSRRGARLGRRDPRGRGAPRRLGAGHHRRRQDPSSRRPTRSTSRMTWTQVLDAVDEHRLHQVS